MKAADMPRKFKGIWIPKEIWFHPKLTPLQKCVVAEIDSLSDAESPCFASDAYFAEMFQVSLGRMRNILSELRMLGIIESCGFDTQNRRLLRLKIHVTETVKPFTETVTATVTETVTDPIKERDKNLENSKEELHEARALWLQAFEQGTSKPYRQRPARYVKAENAALKALLDGGMKPAEIGDVALRMFKAKPTATNGALWYFEKGMTIEGFCANITNIEDKLNSRAPAMAGVGLTPEEIAADEEQKQRFGTTW